MTTVSARMRSNRKPRPADQELARLAESLSLSRNGGFALLSYDTVEQRTQWLEALRARLEPADFHSPPLPVDGIGLVPQIAEISSRSGFATQPLTVLVVEGIEALDMAARERLVVNLNLMRTRLSETAYPLLFCADSAVLDQFVHDAPDLFDRIGLWADLRGQVPPAIARPPAMSVEEQYLATLIRRLRLVEFRGILSINKPVALPLTDFYVPRQASQTVIVESLAPPTEVQLQRSGRLGRKGEDGDTGPSAAFRPTERRRETRALVLVDAVRNNRTLVVLADPGAGKTTLLRYVALVAAEGEPERAGLPPLEEGWLPLLIPCLAYGSALESRPGLSLLDFIRDYLVQQYDVADADQMIEAALRTNRALLLFDGLDEIQDSRRVTVALAISDLLRTWCRSLPQSNRAIISSRIIGYGAAPIYSADALVTLRDFADPEIAQFLRGWCVAYEHFARGDIPEAERDGIAQAEALVAEINSNAGAHRLAGNPLLLTIMALIQRQGAKLPERRVELYDIAIRTLIETWNRTRSLSGVALLNLPDPRLTATLLGEVALWMQQHGVAAATAAELLPVLTEAHQRRGSPEPEAAAAAFLHDVQHYSGLLVERGDDAYSFLHLTFQEYFAARALADMADADARWRILKPHLPNPRWRETLLLTTGELGIMKRRESEVTDLVERILKIVPMPPWLFWLLRRRDWLAKPHWKLLVKMGLFFSDTQIEWLAEQYLQRRLLLAGQMLVDDLDVSHTVAEKVIFWLILLMLSPIQQQRADAGALLKRLPVHLRDFATQQLIDMLRKLGHRRLWLRERTDLIAALGRLGNPVPEVMDILVTALQHPNKWIRGTATSALGNLSSTSTRVQDALTNALGDADPDVRFMTVQAIGKLAIIDPPTMDALTNALHDPDADVRFMTVQTIGKLSNIDPPTMDTLVNTLHDPDKRIKLLATKVLSKLGGTTPSVLDALMNALQDPDESVRYAAAEILGNLGNATPPILDALTNAIHDSDQEVMYMAVFALRNLGFANSSAINALASVLHDKNANIRLMVAFALGDLLRTTPPLLDTLKTALLRDSDERVRTMSNTIDKINNNSHSDTEALIFMLHHEDANFRFMAANTLGKQGFATLPILNALMAALRDQNKQVRHTAARAIGNLGNANSEILQALIKSLHDSEEWVRSAAAESLGKLHISTRDARLALLETLEDDSLLVRNTAYIALIGEDELVAPVQTQGRDEEGS